MRFCRDTGADFNVNKFTFSPIGGGSDMRLESRGGNFGVKASRFGFDIAGSSGQVIFVDACTNLANPGWSPLATNTLPGVPFYFSDPDWTNPVARFCRLRWP